jgi:hypothetical protein
MTRSEMLTTLIASGAVVLTSAVTPASLDGAWRGEGRRCGRGCSGPR